MAKSTTYGPAGTAVPDVTSVGVSGSPLNFDADFRVIAENGSSIVMTDITSPSDQPSTLRIAQQSIPNVYANTGIDPACYLPSRKGTATVVEIKEIWAHTDSEDSSYLKLVPVRLAITANLPDNSLVTADAVERLVARAVAALYEQGDGDITAGLAALLHGVVRK